LDLVAQRRLGDVEARGSTAEVELLRNGQEVAQNPRLKIDSSTLSLTRATGLGRHRSSAPSVRIAGLLKGDEQMKIAVFGKGNVGGGLADLWERAGHQVTRLGRDGGNVADADVVLVAVPGDSIVETLPRLTGLAGKTVIDATNRIGVGAPDGFASNAAFVQSVTGGPTAKSFNINFASLYGRLAEARVRPSNLWCGDEETREVVEQLNHDAGYDPVFTGPLQNAAQQEALVTVIFAIGDAMGPYVYRFAPVDQL
jgi:hypothetical protein